MLPFSHGFSVWMSIKTIDCLMQFIYDNDESRVGAGGSDMRNLASGRGIDIGDVASESCSALDRLLRYAMREAVAQNRFATVKHIQAAIGSLSLRASTTGGRERSRRGASLPSGHC